jgi:hypothetical protein
LQGVHQHGAVFLLLDAGATQGKGAGQPDTGIGIIPGNRFEFFIKIRMLVAGSGNDRLIAYVL